MTPLLRTTALGVVSIFFTAVIGTSSTFPILDHIANIVQGSNTRTLVALNAPNWGFGQPLATPQFATIATTTGGTLASSTPISFEVAALDGDGTTTVSLPISLTTDPASVMLAAEAINLSWSPVVGAQGYAIYVSTTTPANYNVYWLATSTSGTFTYTSTSTSVLSGSYTKEDTTAFSTRILPGSNSFFNGGSFGFGTSSPASSTPIDINGYVRASTSATSTACYAGTAGVIFYNAANSHEWGCNGTAWTKIF
jgi:hypothetical protein